MLFLTLFVMTFCDVGDSVVDAINKFRIQNRLKPLKRDPQLEKAAAIQSKFMRNTNTVTHFNKDKNHTLLQRVKNSSYNHLKFIGQYVLFSTELNYLPVFQEILRQHAENNYLKKDFEDIGIAHAESKSGRSYWTVVFASKFNNRLVDALNK